MYKVWLSPTVHAERKRLPGNVRQRIIRMLDELANTPRPSRSIRIEPPMTTHWEVRRIQLDDWRIVYAIDEP